MMPKLPPSLLIALVLLLPGCGDDDTQPCDPDSFDCLTFEEPRDVISGLVIAYESRNCADYARLLADDFRFHFDEEFLPPGGPAEWPRNDDSTATCAMFQSRQVTGIRLSLTPGDDEPVTTPDRESWRLIRISDTFLEVDFAPEAGGGEVLTYRVDGDAQEFYLRRGRTAGDTLASSPTAERWFLVEWRDLGFNGRASRALPRAPAAAGPTEAASISSWSYLKAFFR